MLMPAIFRATSKKRPEKSPRAWRKNRISIHITIRTRIYGRFCGNAACSRQALGAMPNFRLNVRLK